MLDAGTLDAPAERPAGFDLAAYWSSALQRLERELCRRRGRVRATALADAPPDDRATVELTIPLESSDYAVEQLAHLSPDVEVLQPRALRKAVAERLAAALRPYGSS